MPTYGLTNLRVAAEALSAAWHSSVIGRVGTANLKVVRMDGAPYPVEIHADAEALLVIDGELRLVVDGDAVTVRAGEVYLVAPGRSHAVEPGSRGTLVIIDA